jgi:outer membrane receptor protein involved in Fe transport
MFYGTLAPGAGAGSTAIQEIDGNGAVSTKVLNVPADYNGALNNVISQPLNAASETTSGFDFQADYPMELFSGALDWHLVGNYNDERTRTALGVTYDAAGVVGADAPYSAEPKFHANLALTYAEGPWQGTVQVRYIGTSRLNAYWQSGVQVDNNEVPDVAYVDLRASYQWTKNIELYAAVDNTFNTPPPNVPSTTGGTTTNLTIWDGLGRAYRAGLRFDVE